MHTLATILRSCGRVLIGLERIVIALMLMIGLTAYGLANYTATQGAGTNFGSVVIGGVHFFSNLVCDFTTANQCAAVKAASTPAALTDPALVVQNAQEHLDLIAPIPACGTSPCTQIIGTVSNDPCATQLKTNLAIASATGTTQLVAPSGSTQVYVCSFSLIAGATAVVNLVGGTGATCTTGTPVAALGSTTAASGMSLAANGGLTFGNGGATVVRTTTAGHGLCLIQSGTTALAGNITYIQQ